MWGEPNRFTPYHYAHTTAVAGLSTIYSGDDRFYNNIFIGPRKKDKNYKPGLESYSKAKLPVFINNNVYYNGAKAFNNEVKRIESREYNPKLKLVEDDDSVYLHITLDQAFFNHKATIITSD